MKDQNFWTDFKIHNMKWSGQTVTEEDKNPAPLAQPLLSAAEEFLHDLQKTKEKPQIKEPEVKKEPEKEVKPEVKKEPEKEKEVKSLPDGIPSVSILCRPAVIREKQDGIYGDKYKTIEYGKAYQFQAVMIEAQDLFIKMWTKASVTRGSTLFPQNKEKRWWRVQEISEKTGGWIVTAIPTSEQVYFD